MRNLLAATVALAITISSAGSASASAVAVCPTVPAPGHFTCYALVEHDSPGKPSPRNARSAGSFNADLAQGAVNPSGYHPANLQAAYGLVAAAAKAGGTQTVAVVDAYDDPNAAADLATYRSTFRLPACGTGCFTKVNETGGSTPPAPSASWAQETSADLEMVSAVCPNCKILLVEAKSTSFRDLFTAESYAIAHATEVSNSWGGPEFHGENAYDVYLQKPIPITFAAGDDGYGVRYPAASPYVTAVGGTTLSASAGARGYSETAWSGSGSGCSAYEP
ncbi:MAG: peptidase S8, partial [Solirubrobacteraceae bacterium]